MKTQAKVAIVFCLALLVAGAVYLKERNAGEQGQRQARVEPAGGSAAKLPKPLDLGAGKCIPCKAMAPILEELKTEYAGRMEVEFIDVWKNPDVSKQHGIDVIPTQIFYDAEGKELFRHVGFYGKEDILGKWQDLGFDLGHKAAGPIVREEPIRPDSRPRDQVCFMCDGEVNPTTRTWVKGSTDERILCSPHCYFIYFSSLVKPDPSSEEAKVHVTDFELGDFIPAGTATYLYGMDAAGRPTIAAFRTRDAAVKRQQTTPGNIIAWDQLRSKELATRCAFCDRAVYPEDGCAVKFASARGYGCCTHCSMGVAARIKEDIEVEAKDALTGKPIVVKTLDGQISLLEPATAVAWFGQKRDASGKWVSAGCFKQGFFVNQANLQQWLEKHPTMTGRQITIAQALADKMKLTPAQIAGACKVGECK